MIRGNRGVFSLFTQLVIISCADIVKFSDYEFEKQNMASVV